MKHNKLYYLLIIFLLCPIAKSNTIQKIEKNRKADNGRDQEIKKERNKKIFYLKKYFQSKKKGEYNQAVKDIYQKLLIEEDPNSIMADIFRLNEALQYPEQIESGIIIINKLILKHTSNLYLSNVLKNLKINYLLISGKFIRAHKLKLKSGFINSFSFLGPFSFKGEQSFNSFKIRTQMLSNTKYYKGKFFPIKWVKIKSDRQGKIAISDLYKNEKDTFYHSHTKIKINLSGTYTLFIGKTGHFKIIINNKLVFINNLKHEYFPGQYIVKLFLHKGVYPIKIFSGGNYNSQNMFSLQLYNNKNIPYRHEKKTINNYKENLKVKIKNTALVPQILYLNNPKNNFDYGYNLLSYCLNSKKNLVTKQFSSIKKEYFFYSEALYYAGLSEFAIEKKERLWKDCLIKDPQNIECLEKLARIKMDHNFYSQADKFIVQIKKAAPFSIINHRVKAIQYINLGWEFEAQKKINILNSNYFKSAALFAKIQLYNNKKDLKKLIDSRTKLTTLNYYNSKNALELLNNIKYLLTPEKQLKLTEKFINVFPRKIIFRLNAAQILYNMKKYTRAIAILSATEYMAPYNTDLLFLMGKTYKSLNKKKQAAYYFKRAMLSAPENKDLNDYYKVFYGKELKK